MKHIRSVLAAGLLSFGAAAVVSAQAPANGAGAAKAHEHGNSGKAGKAGMARGGRRGGPGMGADRALLRGITLSDAEKANLKTVRAKYAPQIKALRDQYKPKAGEARPARGDTAAMRQRWEKNQPLRDQLKTIALAERNDIRAALTPANQAKFDANVKQVEERLAKRAEKGKAHRKP